MSDQEYGIPPSAWVQSKAQAQRVADEILAGFRAHQEGLPMVTVKFTDPDPDPDADPLAWRDQLLANLGDVYVLAMKAGDLKVALGVIEATARLHST